MKNIKLKYLILFQLNFIFFNFTMYSFQPEKTNLYSDSSDISKADFDGPYIFYSDNSITLKQILRSSGRVYCETDTYNIGTKNFFSAHVNDTFSFQFSLNKNLKIYPCIYDKVEKIAVISDIEGNFFALRDFLLNNNIIDNNNNWIFGNGHLVLTGDMMDRGLNVTETLWFIYMLEQDAIKHGGFVHYILGNHEILNMNNDLRYVRNKYFKNCELMGIEYKELYTPDTELGRWLATKNIIEKVGNYLFLHGGISEELGSFNLSIEDLNNKAREYYFSSKEAKNSSDSLLKIIFSGKTSPFWYRGFIKETAKEDFIELLLNKYNSKKLIVGHTIVKNITSFYNGKVIGVDVDHAEGITEGLIIENGIIYRADKNGKKEILK